MEDRVRLRAEAQGAALIAFAVIAAITLTWWALALWPAGALEPEWLARTRAACFGATRGGLPDAGGWILLIGEPLGMFGTLVLVFGDALRADVRRIQSRRVPRALALTASAVCTSAFVVLGARVVRAWTPSSRTDATLEPARRVGRPAPQTALVDQHGQHVRLSALGPAIVTFAYGHCTTVCPAGVSTLRAMRRRLGRGALPIIVITLDPWRDTPDRLPGLAAHWALETSDRVLSGSVDDVSGVLAALGIATKRDDVRGDVEHVATTLLLDSRGSFTWRIDGPPDRIAPLLVTE